MTIRMQRETQFAVTLGEKFGRELERRLDVQSFERIGHDDFVVRRSSTQRTVNE